MTTAGGRNRGLLQDNPLADHSLASLKNPIGGSRRRQDPRVCYFYKTNSLLRGCSIVLFLWARRPLVLFFQEQRAALWHISD